MYAVAKWLIISVFLARGFDTAWDSREEVALQPEPESAITIKMPSTISVSRVPDLATFTPSNRKYTLECAFKMSNSTDGGESRLTEICGPKMTVCDGERIIVCDSSQKPVVVAEKDSDTLPTRMLETTENKHPYPSVVMQITRHLKEGSTIEASVLGIDELMALVDIAYDFRVVRQEEKSRGVRVEYVKGRAIECVELGKSTDLQLKDIAVVVRVDRVEDSN